MEFAKPNKQLGVSSDSDDSDESEYESRNNERLKINGIGRPKNKNLIREMKLPTRQPHCFTKNAIMARRNRLKKKQYLEELECQITKLKQENSSLSSILSQQSSLITQLRKEVKYMKSILANNQDISNLLKLINHNTGMSVSTSLNKALTNNYFSKNEHPWAETNVNDLLSPFISNTNSDCLFDVNELYATNADISMLDMQEENNEDIPIENGNSDVTPLSEHNYTINNYENETAGICLHISKHRVSLEFCSTCSDNATEIWNGVDTK